MKTHFRLGLLVLLLILFSVKLIASGQWTGTWGTAVQQVEPNNMAPQPGLEGNTLRQIVRVSIGGDKIRLKLSNEFGKTELGLARVEVAEFLENGHVSPKHVVLTFSRSSQVLLQAGASIVSDVVRFKLKPRMTLAVTIGFTKVPSVVTGHPGSRTTSFLVPGLNPADSTFNSAVKTDHWYFIQGLEVFSSKKTAALVVIGNSITDGRGTDTNKQNRWTDRLSERLLANPVTKGTGVLNMGIGGNCVVRGGLGPAAVNRFDRDVLAQAGVRWVVVFEGVNDIGGTRDTPEATNQTAENLIAAYREFIKKAHAKGLRIYGATIMPFKGNSYYTVNREACRNKVNEWIRTSGEYDGFIDFDKLMEDPANPGKLPADQVFQNDFLHPNAAGYQKMGNAVDLQLFKSY